MDKLRAVVAATQFSMNFQNRTKIAVENPRFIFITMVLLLYLEMENFMMMYELLYLQLFKVDES